MLVGVTERSHVPHKKKNISSCHMIQKATIEFKGEVNISVLSSLLPQKGTDWYLAALRGERIDASHTSEDISMSNRYKL